MDELLDLVEKNIKSIKSTIERNKKYHKYPFTNNCDHYYTLILLQNRLDNWESFYKIILRFKNSRCTPVSKKSGCGAKL
jgi:4-hydroxyphenylpyruvate dioxygenase-like putative hemolysin